MRVLHFCPAKADTTPVNLALNRVFTQLRNTLVLVHLRLCGMDGKVFVEISGLGEWAPSISLHSSPTPSLYLPRNRLGECYVQAMGDGKFSSGGGPIYLRCLYSGGCMLAHFWKRGCLVSVPLCVPSENPHFLGSFSFLFVLSSEPKIAANLAPGSACQYCIA